MNANALDKIEYGMFVLTAQDNGKDNGCIINVVSQVTDTPRRIAFTVNKKNMTHDMVMNTGKFTISILSENTNMEVIEHFGFHSGHDTNKFENYTNAERAENGIYYINKYSNAYITGEVFSKMDLGTHTLFLADVINEKVLNETPSLTYENYHNNIKPKTNANTKIGWVCKVCGYVYEGENIPDDFICPWCKHGVSDFEKIEIK
jgi:flavin reductase (DIM6/NTAB) family NADH-FMN oxidoreductase RutF